MKKTILAFALTVLSFSSAHAVNIDNCSIGPTMKGTHYSSALDMSITVSNAIRDFDSQLGSERGEAIEKLKSMIIAVSPECEHARQALELLDQNFMLLFKVRN